ncbi:CPBP family intramembrane glutamic endopeptidase [Hufsiella ginkgonis]|uniref:CPBP family intramembrane metalloprotease n=1 Tax=Hufsiella ginkgonis TaxID=2695274 RepID=A0A7K1XV56_9SPHI|nr:CPBP family intramembrane glutamic endopeptidase [Hufsiella ginkgonis]MXV14678.1 CPBP family intramembrane metalloprotease [Hufsiella ginkgonis]
MQKTKSSDRHPFELLVLLLVLILPGMIISMVAALFLSKILYGVPRSVMQMDIDFAAYPGPMRVIQLVSSIGTFVIPALIWARICSRRPFAFLKMNNTAPITLFAIAALLLVLSGPLLQLTVQLNQQMKLPGFLKGIEDWMRTQEDQMMEITKQLLVMKSFPILLINLLMIAVIPAIGEELIFRGGMQQMLTRWTKNHHAAIWITAITFSAIHMQFYGFLPRMLLGALFGYLFVWGRSLWIPITAHFINNGVSVLVAYVYQQKGLPVEKSDELNTGGWQLYAVSFLFTVLLLVSFYFISKKGSLKSTSSSNTL